MFPPNEKKYLAAPKTEAMLTYRRATAPDLDILRTIAEETFRLAWQHMNDPEAFEAYCVKAFAPEILLEEIRQPDAEFYLVYHESDLAAYIKLNLNRSRADLENAPGAQLERIYVRKEFQSRQFGTQILEFVEKRAADTGAEWLWLSVWKLSPRTIEFYEKNGFTIFGVETFWVGFDPQSDWLMKRRIAGKTHFN
jgi:GNAT superfamily N-acetyltransferase